MSEEEAKTKWYPCNKLILIKEREYRSKNGRLVKVLVCTHATGLVFRDKDQYRSDKAKRKK